MSSNDLFTAGTTDSDERAFNKIYRQYHRRLLMEAFYLLESEQQAKDIVQEIFIDCWNKQYWKKASKLSGYLGAAVRNRCLNQLKQQQTTEKRNTTYYNMTAASYSPEQAHGFTETIMQERLENLEIALNNMPEKTGAVLKLYYLKSKDRQTVATELGISINTVKTVLQRGLRTLRTKLR